MLKLIFALVPKVLVISDHRLHRSPSQRYRYEQYISYLEENGFQFTFSPIITESDDKVFYNKGKLFSKALITLKSIFIRLKILGALISSILFLFNAKLYSLAQLILNEKHFFQKQK